MTLPAKVRAYEVSDGRVAGYRTIALSGPATARAGAPVTVAMPTFDDPDGTLDLVQVLTGKLKGRWVAPDGKAVVYTPD